MPGAYARRSQSADTRTRACTAGLRAGCHPGLGAVLPMYPPAVQSELSQVSGDRAPTDLNSVGMQRERDSRCRPFLLPPHRLDQRYRLTGRCSRLPDRSGRPVQQPELAVPVDPFRRGRPRDAHLRSHVRDRTGTAALDKPRAPLRGEGRVPAAAHCASGTVLAAVVFTTAVRVAVSTDRCLPATHLVPRSSRYSMRVIASLSLPALVLVW